MFKIAGKINNVKFKDTDFNMAIRSLNSVVLDRGFVLHMKKTQQIVDQHMSTLEGVGQTASN
jgi:hypothetical protein